VPQLWFASFTFIRIDTCFDAYTCDGDRSEIESRTWTNGELYVIDELEFYAYGSIPLCVIGHEDEFLWGAWAKVSEEDFFEIEDLFFDDKRQSRPTFRGVLATDIPFYPQTTLNIPLTIEVQDAGFRPIFKLDSVNHTLALDNLNGVAAERILEIQQWFASLKRGK
jgi:hypothetical protein